jgi:hypothetical protein
MNGEGMPKRSDIERATAPLLGKALWNCTRAASMAMFDFGNRRQSVAWGGAKKEVGELALHVQCTWRIAREDCVIVGSRDIQYPADYPDDDEIPAEFDWDRDPTRLDKLVGSVQL